MGFGCVQVNNRLKFLTAKPQMLIWLLSTPLTYCVIC